MIFIEFLYEICDPFLDGVIYHGLLALSLGCLFQFFHLSWALQDLYFFYFFLAWLTINQFAFIFLKALI